MAKTHVPYAPEFRRQMVALVRAGRDPADLAREFTLWHSLPDAAALRRQASRRAWGPTRRCWDRSAPAHPDRTGPPDP